jgi:hypothetical protein
MELNGSHVGKYVKTGNREEREGRSFELAGMLVELKHGAQELRVGGGFRTRCDLTVLIESAGDAQHINLRVHPDTELWIEEEWPYPEEARRADAEPFPLKAQ